MVSSDKESIYNETFGMRSRIAVDDFYNRKLGTDKDHEKPEIDLLSKRNIIVRKPIVIHLTGLLSIAPKPGSNVEKVTNIKYIFSFVRYGI